MKNNNNDKKKQNPTQFSYYTEFIYEYSFYDTSYELTSFRFIGLHFQFENSQNLDFFSLLFSNKFDESNIVFDYRLISFCFIILLVFGARMKLSSSDFDITGNKKLQAGDVNRSCLDSEFKDNTSL